MNNILSEDFIESIFNTFEKQRGRILRAVALADEWSPNIVLQELPGSHTGDRIACRISNGDTLWQAAAGEYCLRWRMALRNPVFDPPHLLGM